MDTVEIACLDEVDRPALCSMLESSEDFPRQILSHYRRRGSRYCTLVAWADGALVGMLSGSFDSDFAESGAFDSFDLPPAPHAFLDRVHVHESVRGLGTGRLLVLEYARLAASRGCAFMGGSVDLSSDSLARRGFFEDLGFTIREWDNFGIELSTLLESH